MRNDITVVYEASDKSNRPPAVSTRGLRARVATSSRRAPTPGVAVRPRSQPEQYTELPIFSLCNNTHNIVENSNTGSTDKKSPSMKSI